MAKLIGNEPNQVPTNGDLGTMAYQDSDNVVVGNLSADGAVVINESGADVDFRIESDTNANAFFLDGATGYVGIGVPSPTAKLFVKTTDALSYGAGFSGDTKAIRITHNSINTRIQGVDNTLVGSYQPLSIGGSYTVIESNGTERMRIDSSGRVGIGTSSPNASYKLTVSGSSAGIVPGMLLEDTVGKSFGVYSASNSLIFRDYTGSAERMRIDSSGNLLVGTTSFGGGATVGFQINATNNTASQYAQLIKNSSGTEIFQMRCNGGLANFSANNVNLSDERVKTDIKLASSYLDKICAIPVKTFRYKNQTDDLLNLGVIAQDVEAVAPELVDVDGFGETPDDGIPLKAIYETDLKYALMKCIQELSAKVDTLQAELKSLKGN